MTKATDIDKTAEKLVAAAEHGELPPSFNADDIQAIREMVYAWNGLKAFGKIAGVVQSIAKYIGWLVLLYIAIKGGLIDFIRGTVGK